MDVPWVWVRRQIAARWGIPPPDVEAYPAEEITIEMRLMETEAECAPRP